MRVSNVLKCKQIFKRQQTLIFMGICIKIALFCLKTSQKAPRGPLGPPRMTKIVFSSCQDMETLCQEKEFLSYLPQEKSWYGLTMGTAAMLDFRALGRRWPSGISGNVKKFKGDNVLDHLKSKNGCSGGVHLGCFWLPYYMTVDRMAEELNFFFSDGEPCYLLLTT